MSDLKIDPILTDITFVNGLLVTGSVVDDIKQRIQDNLNTLFGEWFLDITYGIDWPNLVFKQRNPNLSVLDALLKSQILTVANQGLTNGLSVIISDFSMSINNQTRELTIKYGLMIGTVPVTGTVLIGP